MTAVVGLETVGVEDMGKTLRVEHAGAVQVFPSFEKLAKT